MKTINRILSAALCVVIVLVTAVSAYALWDQYNISNEKKFGNAYSDESNFFLNSKLPAVSNLSAAEVDPNLKAVIAVNPEVIAWLQVNGTGIDYAVAQSPNGNSKYISTDIDGTSYSIAGSIYLDYRNQANFSDPNNVFYGHNMSGGRMFGDLKKFADSSFFNTNTSGTLKLPGGNYSFETVAYIVTVASDSEIINPNVSDKQAWLDAVKNKAANYRDIASAADTFLTLVTCGTGDSGFTNERNVLVVRLKTSPTPVTPTPTPPPTPTPTPANDGKVSFNIPAKKVLTGDTPRQQETFSFVLKADDPTNPMPEGSQSGKKTVTRKGAGKIDFGAIEFNRVGIYGYSVYEKAGSTDGYTYDDTVYKVEIAVLNGGTVQYRIAPTIRAVGADSKSESALFTNIYRNGSTPPPTPPVTGNGKLTVSKTIAGNAAERDRAFNFTVNLSDSSISGTYGDMTFKNGIASFALKGGETKTASGLPAGTSYVVVEADYSSSGYTTTKTGDSGKIIANQTTTAKFINTKNGGGTEDDGNPHPKTADLTDSMPLLILFGLLFAWLIVMLLLFVIKRKSIRR